MIRFGARRTKVEQSARQTPPWMEFIKPGLFSWEIRKSRIMYFVAEIKPTSTLHQRWSNRNLRCGILQGVGFVRKGRTYVADKVSPAEMEILKKEVAVRF